MWKNLCQWIADIYFYRAMRNPDKEGAKYSKDMGKYFIWIDLKHLM